MQQVLLRIPLQANWLPFGLHLWIVLGVLFLAAAAAVYWAARFAPRWKLESKSVQGAAVWVAVAGAIVAGLALFFEKTGLPIYGFGMMLFLAFVVCNWVGARRAEHEGVPKEVIQDLAIWLIVGGLVGARLNSLLCPQGLWQLPGGIQRALADPWRFLMQFAAIWDGGIVLYGSVAGGLAAYVLARFLVFRKVFRANPKINTLKLADIVAPSLALGICLGRIGCFLNGCCYGQVACPDCAIAAVSFPLSAPPRYDLVNKGYQTAAGFTLADEPPAGPAVVGEVEKGSAADRAGLQTGDKILKADGVPLSGDGARYGALSAVEQLNQYLGSFSDWPRGKNDLTLTVRNADGERTVTLWPRTLGLHPTQLYESVSMLLLFLLLTAYYPLRRHDGQVVALLMICYAAHRYVNELLRADDRPMDIETGTSILLFLAGVALWIWLWRRPAQYRFQALPKVKTADQMMGEARAAAGASRA